MNWGVVLGFYRFQQCRIESLDSTTVQGRLVLETKVHPIHAPKGFAYFNHAMEVGTLRPKGINKDILMEWNADQSI